MLCCLVGYVLQTSIIILLEVSTAVSISVSEVLLLLLKFNSVSCWKWWYWIKYVFYQKKRNIPFQRLVNVILHVHRSFSTHPTLFVLVMIINYTRTRIIFDTWLRYLVIWNRKSCMKTKSCIKPRETCVFHDLVC